MIEIPVVWDGPSPPAARTRVRIMRDADGEKATVYSSYFVQLGTTEIPWGIRTDYFTGLVTEEGRGVMARFYGV